MATLADIRLKVRRLTRTPSPTQVTDAQIDTYVNDFILCDFPEHLRLFSLRDTFTFYTEPYVDKYDSTNASTQLNDFKNNYITVHQPVYIDGNPVSLYQDRDKFYGLYPRTNARVRVATGDGVTLNFDGTLDNAPITYENVLFSTIAADNTSLELHDLPGGNHLENFLGGSGIGAINYVTGEYDLMFNVAPAAGAEIIAHTRPYNASVPQSLLFFNNTFYVRPIPDQAYRIDMEVYKRPTALLQAGSLPELEQWWQYIAYGAAKKLFEDRTDEEGVRMLMPEFKMQERLVLRKTIVQNTNNRVATIYTENFGTHGRWWNHRY